MSIIDSELDASPSRRFRKRWIAWAFIAAWLGVGVWNTTKPMPDGTDVSTRLTAVGPDQVEFLYDLTSSAPTGETLHEQRIFDAMFRIIDQAQSFIVADFFLINDDMGDEIGAGGVHRPLSRELADRLIARKRASPELPILLITDPINDAYGGAPSHLLQELRSAGVEVVVTDLERLRDSNPMYSSFWRMALQWWGNSHEGGRLLNPFASDGSGITLRSWLELLNFKANHRKLIVADRPDGRLVALVTSANPHDASSAHSNVALRFSGGPAHEIVGSEMALARFSGWRGNIYASSPEEAPPNDGAVRLSFITEEAIADHLLQAIDKARSGDTLRIATFYLSDRDVIDALLAAAARGVAVKMILDPNRDAFGRQKDGVPNRPVANELVTQSNGRIEVRWYRTHGEQFHTKMATASGSDYFVASLGSANLTRRNLGNYNLEANVALQADPRSRVALEMTAYFDRLWNNDGPTGTEFTAAFGAYQDEHAGRYWRYRLMEATGLSTF